MAPAGPLAWHAGHHVQQDTCVGARSPGWGRASSWGSHPVLPYFPYSACADNELTLEVEAFALKIHWSPNPSTWGCGLIWM